MRTVKLVPVKREHKEITLCNVNELSFSVRGSGLEYARDLVFRTDTSSGYLTLEKGAVYSVHLEDL